MFLSLSFFLIVLSYLTKEKTKTSRSKNYYKDKGRYLRRIIKDSWYEIADNYMKEAGYFISTEFFILINLIVIAISIYISLKSIMMGDLKQLTSILRIVIIILLPFNLIISKMSKKRQDKIRLELCNIQDMMYFQSKIGTPDDVVLTYAAHAAKEPLKEPLQYIANAPKVKKGYEESLKRLSDLSSITELQSFCFALAQKQEVGISEKSFKTQSNLLKRNKRIRRKILRQQKRTKLIVSAFLLFICYVLLVSVPIIQEVIANLDLIFR